MLPLAPDAGGIEPIASLAPDAPVIDVIGAVGFDAGMGKFGVELVDNDVSVTGLLRLQPVSVTTKANTSATPMTR